MSQVPTQPPDAPLDGGAPPLAAPPVERPSKWPTVLGIILLILSICAAAQGLLTMVFQPLLAVMADTFEEMAESTPGLEAQIAQFQVMREYMVETLVVSGLGTLVALLLLRGSIGLLKRRGYGPPWSLTWAMVKMLYAILAAYYTFCMMRDQFAGMAEAQERSTQPGPPPALFESMSVLGLVFATFQLLFLWAMPVFLVIWLRRAPIREETSKWT